LKGYHHATYPAIDPSRPELSLKGKNVIVTGGGGTIGSAIVGAFAEAGVSLIGIVSRNQKTLDTTKAKRSQLNFPNVNIVIATADITDATSIEAAFTEIRHTAKGPIDVLISNAGYLSRPSTITESEPREMVDDIRNQRQGLVQHASSVPSSRRDSDAEWRHHREPDQRRSADCQSGLVGVLCVEARGNQSF
jgi:NAD(P)-dependent dehydrogenase (short-subunit alcohol dehydrogenase family)